MKKCITGIVVGVAACLMSGAVCAQSDSPLTVRREGGALAHIFPTYTRAKELGLVRSNPKTPTGPALQYHGGPIMAGNLRFYVVFWQPSTLQDGTPTTLSPGYRTVEASLVGSYFGRPISSNNTQYFQQNGSVKTYITGVGVLSTFITDTQPYPASGCDASIGPNCFTDAQLRAEVQRVITAQGWSAGLGAMFIFFTSKGEGSCFDNTTSACSTETANVTPAFCAYHSWFGSSPNIIYSNEPFGNPNECLGSGQQPNLNNGGAEADPAATAASHEISEAITDPLLNAWYGSGGLGSEIGDLCAYIYGSNSYDSGLANQLWNGRFFELQTEYDNHHSACVQVGP